MLITTIVTLFTCLTTVNSSVRHEGYLSPLYGMKYADKLPNQYLILFHDGYTLEQHFLYIDRNLSSLPGFLKLRYGYAATMDDSLRDEQVRRDPGVRSVETNRVITIEPYVVECGDTSPVCPSPNDRILSSLLEDPRQQHEGTCPSSDWVLQRSFRGSDYLC